MTDDLRQTTPRECINEAPYATALVSLRLKTGEFVGAQMHFVKGTGTVRVLWTDIDTLLDHEHVVDPDRPITIRRHPTGRFVSDGSPDGRRRRRGRRRSLTGF